MLSQLSKIRDRIMPCPSKAHCAYKWSHNVGHGIYFIAAGLEGHGIYSIAALSLFGIMVIGIMLHEEGA